MAKVFLFFLFFPTIFLLFNFMIAFTEMLCYMLYCMLFILFPPPFSLPPSCCLSVMKSSTLDVSSCLLSLTGPWQNVHHDALFPLEELNEVADLRLVQCSEERHSTQTCRQETNKQPFEIWCHFPSCAYFTGGRVRLNLHAPTGSQPPELNSRFPVAWSD